MGNNGQQLMGCLPLGSTKVRVSGTNQINRSAQWDGVAGNAWCQGDTQVPAPDGSHRMVWETLGWSSYGFTTNGWWWKGNVQIWWNDSAGNTHTFQASVPVNDEPSPGLGPYPITDWWVVFAPEYNPSVDHVETLPHGVHEVKPVPGGHTVKKP